RTAFFAWQMALLKNRALRLRVFARDSLSRAKTPSRKEELKENCRDRNCQELCAFASLRETYRSDSQSQGANIMSVKKEASGRRSVQVEVEVPGTPEEVWQAIATGPGISSWFVPTEIVEQDGKPVAVKSNFGPGMESTATVISWDAPRKFTAESPGWTP